MVKNGCVLSGNKADNFVNAKSEKKTAGGLICFEGSAHQCVLDEIGPHL